MKNSGSRNRWHLKYFLVLILLIGLILVGCTQINSAREKFSIPGPTTQTYDSILSFPSGERISLNTQEITKFVTNILGPEYLLFNSHTDFYWMRTNANEVILDLNKRLSDANWQIETDWGHHKQNALILSTWKKKSQQLSILMLDDLDSVGIDSLSKNYGISGPVPGSTMLVMHMLDKSIAAP